MREKNLINSDNYDAYKKIYEKKEILTYNDIKEVFKNMAIILAPSLLIEMIFPVYLFIPLFFGTLLATWITALKTCEKINERKVEELSKIYPELDVSISNELLYKKIRQYEENRYLEKISENSFSKTKGSNISNNIIYNKYEEHEKILVKQKK